MKETPNISFAYYLLCNHSVGAVFTCKNNMLHLSHFFAEALLVIHCHSYIEKGILHCRMEIRVTLSMKWQSILLSCYFRCYCCNKNLYFLAGKCYNYGAMGHIQARCGRRRRRERKPHSGDSDVRENEIQYHFHGTVKNLKKLK